jgi:cytochrome P450
VLPRGLQVAVLIVAAHYDQGIWGDDAESFRPERYASGTRPWPRTLAHGRGLMGRL